MKVKDRKELRDDIVNAALVFHDHYIRGDESCIYIAQEDLLDAVEEYHLFLKKKYS